MVFLCAGIWICGGLVQFPTVVLGSDLSVSSRQCWEWRTSKMSFPSQGTLVPIVTDTTEMILPNTDTTEMILMSTDTTEMTLTPLRIYTQWCHSLSKALNTDTNDFNNYIFYL